MTGLALLFPGQGAQVPGMGRELSAGHDAAREVYATAQDVVGYDLIRAAGEVTDTTIVQPMLVAYGIAVWRSLAALVDVRPAVSTGHSLGELTALACAGAWDTATAIRLAAVRGELMAACPPGSMAVVFGPSPEVVARVCAAVDAGRVVVANHNSAEQCVISGEVAAVEAATVRLAELAAVVRPLRLSVAAHSPLMAAAAAGFAEVLREVDIRTPAWPVISSVTGTPFSSPADIRTALVAGLTSCVDWPRTVRVVRSHGAGTFVEAGPGTVLTDLSRSIDPDVTVMSCAGGLSAVAARLGRAGGPPEPRPLEPALVACLRTAVGTPDHVDLPPSIRTAEVLEPYAALRAELDQVRAGTSPPSARARAREHLGRILRAKGVAPGRVVELVEQCVGEER